MAESDAERAIRVGRVRRRAMSRGHRAGRPRSTTGTATDSGGRSVLLCALAGGALLVALLLAALPVQARTSELSAVAQITSGADDTAVSTVRDNRNPITFAPSAASSVAHVAGGAPPLAGWYHLAAAEQGVSADLLHALHQVESNAAPDGCLANAQGSGAIGPFQFKRATFRQYGVDGNHDGERDICSFADSLLSAGRYLRALGAGDLDDPRTHRALVRYGTDADRVLSLARSHRDRARGID